MISFLQIIHIIVCFLLITLVLIQAGKGHGLAGAFGSFAGSAAQNLFGARTTDILTKITAYLVAFFFISSLFLAFLQIKESQSVTKNYKKPITEEVSETPTEKAKDIDKKIGELTKKLLNKTKSVKKETEVNQTSKVEEQPKPDEASKTPDIATETTKSIAE